MLEFRYPGSRPFQDTELDRLLFNGREDEKQKLLHLILSEKLVVLFSKSGMGKTSLLNAGVFNLLRQQKYFPMMFRLNNPKESPKQLTGLVYDEIKRITQKNKIELTTGDPTTLWQYFNIAEFWSEDDQLLTPVLVFDQFEEIFTLYSEEERKEFVRQLADLVRGIIPKSIRQTYRNQKKAKRIKPAPDVKVVLSIREDFLAWLEEFSSEIPSILHNRYRLTALNLDQARKAIEEPARLENEHLSTKSFSYEKNTVEAIIKFLRQRRERNKIIESNEIEPFQLQLLCQDIENKVLKKQKRAKHKNRQLQVTEMVLGGEVGMRRILRKFYNNQIKQLSFKLRRKARRLCEKVLIFPPDRRLSIAEEVIVRKEKIGKDILTQLVNFRLIRAEPRLGGTYYELSHDTLVNPIMQSSKKRRIRKWVSLSLSVILLAAIVVVYLWRTGTFHKAILYFIK